MVDRPAWKVEGPSSEAADAGDAVARQPAPTTPAASSAGIALNERAS
jgi:hypothetical protein